MGRGSPSRSMKTGVADPLCRAGEEGCNLKLKILFDMSTLSNWGSALATTLPVAVAFAGVPFTRHKTSLNCTRKGDVPNLEINTSSLTRPLPSPQKMQLRNMALSGCVDPVFP